MRCKIKRECYLKACTKIQWCKYEPWNIPRDGLLEGNTRRRMAQITYRTILIFKNASSYDAGFEAALRSPPRSHGFDISPEGYNRDQRRVHRLGVEDGLKAREDDERDLARRARWEKGAIRRGELDESDREYSRRP